MKRILFLLLFFSQISAFEYNLSIMAIFRDEAPYLKEWIEFHRLVGVEHFYLIDHLSTDHYQDVLQPYIDAGIVDIDHCETEYVNWKWNTLQIKLYRDKMDEIKFQTYWLAIIDIDEFLFPVEEDNLLDLLERYDKYSGLSANWQMYGTSDIEKLNEGDLQIEKFTWKAKENYKDNRFVKSIVKPYHVNIRNISSAHFCPFYPGFYCVDENRKKINFNRSENVSVNKVRINHYWTRDINYLYTRKIPSYAKRRDEKTRDMALEREANTHAVEDTLIWRFLPALKERMENFVP